MQIGTKTSKPIIAIVATSGEDRTRPYVQTIVAHRGDARVLRPGDDFEKLSPNGVMLTGGGDLSRHFYDHSLTAVERKTLGKIEMKREEYESRLLAWASKHDIPTLGICRGCQMLNVFARGTLIPDIPTWQASRGMVPTLDHRFEGAASSPAHDISIETSSQLYKMLGARKRIAVNSSHHQALSRIGHSLKVAARAADGIIEAIEDSNKTFWIGVHFHPERMWKRFPVFSNLFKILMKHARKNRLK